jgi:tripartite-type tricarboxylate transporter receptor subunit TctC
MTAKNQCISRRNLIVGMATVASSVVSHSVFAQNFPSKPLELVVLSSAGSGADITGRALS